MIEEQAAAAGEALPAYGGPGLRASWRTPAVGLAAAFTLAAVVLLLPVPAGLPPEGKRMAAVLLIALVLWSAEVLPTMVTSLLLLILQPIFGVAAMGTAVSTFVSPVFFFVITMFCLAAAITNTGLARRFALLLLSRAGADSRRVVLALMAGTAAISTIMSDVPACAIFAAVALGVLPGAGTAQDRPSRLTKSVMIGIPIASLIGGVATPAGSSVNILGIYYIEQYGHVRVPFLSWMAIGVPLVLALVPLAWWVIMRCLPPEVESIGLAEELGRERRGLGALRRDEKKLLALLSCMVACWILSTWVRQLDITIVAITGVVLMYLPGIDLLRRAETGRVVNWDAVFMIGSVTSLGAASVQTGLAKWLVDISLGQAQGWHVVWLVMFVCAFTVLIHLILPIGPVVCTVLIPPVAVFAISKGQNPALYTLPVAFMASCAFLLPLDAVPLITYSQGHYRFFDMLLPGAIISLCWVILMTLLMVLLAPALGFA